MPLVVVDQRYCRLARPNGRRAFSHVTEGYAESIKPNRQRWVRVGRMTQVRIDDSGERRRCGVMAHGLCVCETRVFDELTLFKRVGRRLLEFAPETGKRMDLDESRCHRSRIRGRSPRLVGREFAFATHRALDDVK